MQKFILLFFFFIFVFSAKFTCLSQNYDDNNKQDLFVDSLLNIIKNTKADTLKVKVYNQLFLIYEFEDDEKAQEYLKKAFDLSLKIDYKIGLSSTYTYLGYFAEDKGNYSEAIKNYLSSLKIVKALGKNAEIASAYNNIGNVYYRQGNYPEALKNHLISLKIREEIGSKSLIATSYNNIGLIYTNQGNYPEAFKNYNASLKILETINEDEIIAATYNNIGNVYNLQENYTEALKNYFSSLKVKEKNGDKQGIALSYGNIGSIYTDLHDYQNALKYYFYSLKIEEEIGDIAGKASSYYGIGYVYSKQHKYNESENYYNKAIKISKEIGYKDCLLGVYKALTELNAEKGNYNSALKNYKLYIIYRDSIDNEETRKQTIQNQMTYEFEKKEAVATAEHKKELENQNAVAKEKSRKQIIIIVFVLVGLLLVVIFAGFILRSLKITRKQKATIEVQKKNVDEKNLQLNQQNEEISTQRDEIEAQRDEIEAQRDLVTEQKVHIEVIHKEVTDSINYAKRIQDALLPVSDSARSVLGEHFILFKPKNIVSGDFYWTTKINNLLFVAVADCTGHGVPGAFMSMLGISFLNEIVQKQEIKKANKILNQLRIEVVNVLQQKGVQGEQKDGMDISLLVLNTETNEAQWAGANNPLYIVRKLKVESDKVENQLSENNELSNFINFQLDELKGDKMPIAIYPKMNDFTNHEFSLQKGDSIFLFTDGYADQFGGSKGRKFMYNKFKELLVNNSCLPMFEQKELLCNSFEKWRTGFEQIDDVTVLGKRI